MGKEKDNEKRLAILENLMTAGLISKPDYAKEVKEATPAAGPDPKVVANIERQIETTEKDYKKFADATHFAATMRMPKYEAALRAAAKARYRSENFEFLDAVEKRMKPNDLIKTFVLQNSPKEINIVASIREDITMDPKKMPLAVAVVEGLIRTNIRNPALKTLAGERDEVIEPLRKAQGPRGNQAVARHLLVVWSPKVWTLPFVTGRSASGAGNRARVRQLMPTGPACGSTGVWP